MNIFMVHVGNFVGMSKFYFMNMAKFCGYEYGEFVDTENFLVDVEEFCGQEILAMEIFLLGM